MARTKGQSPATGNTKAAKSSGHGPKTGAKLSSASCSAADLADKKRAYFLYRNEESQKTPSLTHKQIASQWRELTIGDKETFKQRAAAAASESEVQLEFDDAEEEEAAMMMEEEPNSELEEAAVADEAKPATGNAVEQEGPPVEKMSGTSLPEDSECIPSSVSSETEKEAAEDKKVNDTGGNTADSHGEVEIPNPQQPELVDAAANDPKSATAEAAQGVVEQGLAQQEQKEEEEGTTPPASAAAVCAVVAVIEKDAECAHANKDH
mmetsp:Transcript_2898/g.4453  ORF Transcript_2898/g.4453 Transcript_2898/m.4453 type:complete len:265 (-) Transcript_2898:64-858(-)